MPIKLKDLKARTATVDVYDTLGRPDLKGALNVTYHLYTSDSDEQVKLHALAQENDPKAISDFGADFAVKLLAEWDLLGDDGKPIPITPANIKKLPPNLMAEIGQAIGLDRIPSKSGGAASSAS